MLQIDTAVHVVFLAVLCAVPGFPLAVVLARDKTRSLASVVVQGLFLGLGVALTVGLVAAHSVGVSRSTVGLPLLAISVAAWVSARRHLTHLPRPSATWAGVVTAGVLAIALSLRLDSVYFLAQSADFGEYVNRANVVADGGAFSEWFFQLYSIALALSHLVLGEAASVDLTPFLGMLLLVGLLAVAVELRFGPVVRIFGAIVLTLHVVPVWFSLLPTSEALYATLLVGLLLFLLLAVQRGHHAEAAAAGSFVGLEMVTRGNALLLLPVLVGGVVVGAALVERHHARITMTFTAVAILSTYAGFVYNAQFSYAYFVPYQLDMYLPIDLALTLGSVASPGRFLIGLSITIIGTLLAVGAVEGANRLGGSPGLSAGLLRRFALPFVLLACVVGVAVFGPEVVAHGLRNYGLVFGTITIVGIVSVLAMTASRKRAANAFLAPVLFVGGAFAVLHAYRLRTPRGAPTFLYWDRYLFSEVYPMLAIAGFFGLALIVAAHADLVRRLAHRGWMASAAFGVVGVVALASIGASTALLREERFFDGYYEALAEIDELAGSGDEPIVYVGVEELPDYWFHPNTHRLVALPLAETFDRDVLNVAQLPFEPDAVPTWDEVAATMREAGADTAYVVSAEGGERIDVARSATPPPEGLTARPVGVVDLALPVLDEPLDTTRRQWHSFELHLVVMEVSLASAPAEGV